MFALGAPGEEPLATAEPRSNSYGFVSGRSAEDEEECGFESSDDDCMEVDE